VTAPSNPWVGEWGRVLSRRQARRLSRRFASVGVGIPSARLQQIAAGAPVADDESTDVGFALAAMEIEREERVAKSVRRRRRGIHWLIVAGLVLVMLNALVCMAYAFFVLAHQASPF
jgi:hypothetical protein